MSETNTIPSLFHYYPELQPNLPWKPLGQFPTPIRKIDGLGYNNLWIKQDNLSSSVYGGNKIRKLEFALAAALDQNKKHVVTMGALGTNHGLATAIFCEKLGLKCTLLLFRQPITPDVKQKLLLFNSYRAKMKFRGTKLRAAIALYLTERIRHPGAYFLYAGGSNPTGTIGFVNAAFELKSQIAKGVVPEPAAIFCPVGSNGTLAGLTLGVRLAGLKSKTIGVRVSASHLGPVQVCTPGSVQRLIRSTYHNLKKRCQTLPSIDLTAPLILNDYFGDGYGLPTEAGFRARENAKDKANIILDLTYTAKTFAAVMDHCQIHPDESEPVLYWHTFNSVDLSGQVSPADVTRLPRRFQLIYTEKEEG